MSMVTWYSKVVLFTAIGTSILYKLNCNGYAPAFPMKNRPPSRDGPGQPDEFM
jgi:hypothetical protein